MRKRKTGFHADLLLIFNNPDYNKNYGKHMPVYGEEGGAREMTEEEMFAVGLCTPCGSRRLCKIITHKDVS